MAALMVPFGLKSFFGLYPESCRFLIYRAPAPPGACANAGVAAVADSSTAAARALNEIIFVSPVWIDCRPARRQADKTRRSRFVRRACCPNASYRLAASDADAFGFDVGRDRSRST